jgi:copper chaperone CopZ
LQSTEGKQIDRLKLRLVDGQCASCLPAIRRELEKVRGIEWVGTNPVLDLIFVDFDPKLVGVEEILSLVEKSGYTAVRASVPA